MSIGYFQWTKIGCFRWTRSGCFRRTRTIVGQKAAAHRFSPLDYLGGIETVFSLKTNTFLDRRKEVIPWRYFALRKPAITQ